MSSKQEFFLAVGIVIGLFSVVHNSLHLPLLANYLEWIEQATLTVHLPIYSPGFYLIDLIGAIAVCYFYRINMESPKLWYTTLASCIVIQFGGAITTGLLLGQAPSFLLSNVSLPSLLLVWWLTFCSPFDIYWIYLKRYKFIVTFSQIIGTIGSGLAITSWGVDKALNNVYHLNSHEYSNSTFLIILSGVSSASGSGFLAELLGLSSKFVQTSKYSNFNRSLILSIIYFILIDNNNTFNILIKPLSVRYAHVTIVSIQLINFIIQFNWPNVDPFDYISTSILKFLLIPQCIEKSY